MGRLFFIFMAFVFAPMTAHSQSDDCGKTEVACVLDAAWSATLLLPIEKQRSLAPAFLEIAQLSGQRDLLESWETRFEKTAPNERPYSDYGWEKAKPIIQARGVDGLIEAAKSRDSHLSVGRADALLSAGKRLVETDAPNALKINQALLALSQSASKFERPVLAHAAAELAMTRCDREMLSEAISRSDAPRSLRYAFWEARVSGPQTGLLMRVRSIENEDDTRDVRRVLDGYRAILELGYCRAETPAIGG